LSAEEVTIVVAVVTAVLEILDCLVSAYAIASAAFQQRGFLGILAWAIASCSRH
jgi:ABC-type glycerol-3-phosphate transport system permease component